MLLRGKGHVDVEKSRGNAVLLLHGTNVPICELVSKLSNVLFRKQRRQDAIEIDAIMVEVDGDDVIGAV